jgi:trehalose 6-phosphate phosphatase
VEALEPLRSDPAHAAVLFDIDGTLAPIVRHAADAHVPEATRTLLIEISKRYRLVGCVSGRRAATARQIVAIGSIAYIGNHGGELLRPGATRPELDPDLTAWSERVREFAAPARARAQRGQGGDRGLSLAWGPRRGGGGGARARDRRACRG